ncbi:MAG: hypothetical protein MZV65_22420 [Chromatiales bacterium]|nr:hypothetical protein [Chromatiales bacterium]
MKMANMMKCLRGLFLIFAAYFVLTAHRAAAQAPEYTSDELKILPGWCTAGISQNAEDAAYSKKIHSGCYGAYHYCWGLVRGMRGDYLYAIGEMDYVLGHSKPLSACKLTPELFFRKGEWYVKLKDYENSVKNYRLAINANPKFVLAYHGVSKAFELLGDKKNAIAILKEGIAANPNAAFLKKRLEQVQSLPD